MSRVCVNTCCNLTNYTNLIYIYCYVENSINPSKKVESMKLKLDKQDNIQCNEEIFFVL